MSDRPTSDASSLLAVHSLDHLTLEVPDLAEAARFYGAFGLGVSAEDDGLAVRTIGSPHVWMRIGQGPRKRLAGLTFGVHPGDFGRFAEKLDQRPNDGRLHLRSPDDLPIEIVTGPKVTPHEKSSFETASPANGRRGATGRGQIPLVQPRRLAHISLFTVDVQRSIDFYGEALGLVVSDRSGDDVAFMHAPHGSDHHLVALARSDGGGLHHCSWDVATLSEVGLGAMQMADAGYDRGWGLGRHVLGSNYFHYVRDPWGSYCEYSADMDFVAAGVPWDGGDHPGEDSFYQWGPPPPDDFIRNYETVAG